MKLGLYPARWILRMGELGEVEQYLFYYEILFTDNLSAK